MKKTYDAMEEDSLCSEPITMIPTYGSEESA